MPELPDEVAEAVGGQFVAEGHRTKSGKLAISLRPKERERRERREPLEDCASSSFGRAVQDLSMSELARLEESLLAEYKAQHEEELRESLLYAERRPRMGSTLSDTSSTLSSDDAGTLTRPEQHTGLTAERKKEDSCTAPPPDTDGPAEEVSTEGGGKSGFFMEIIDSPQLVSRKARDWDAEVVCGGRLPTWKKALTPAFSSSSADASLDSSFEQQGVAEFCPCCGRVRGSRAGSRVFFEDGLPSDCRLSCGCGCPDAGSSTPRN